MKDIVRFFRPGPDTKCNICFEKVPDIRGGPDDSADPTKTRIQLTSYTNPQGHLVQDILPAPPSKRSRRNLHAKRHRQRQYKKWTTNSAAPATPWKSRLAKYWLNENCRCSAVICVPCGQKHRKGLETSDPRYTESKPNCGFCTTYSRFGVACDKNLTGQARHDFTMLRAEQMRRERCRKVRKNQRCPFGVTCLFSHQLPSGKYVQMHDPTEFQNVNVPTTCTKRVRCIDIPELGTRTVPDTDAEPPRWQHYYPLYAEHPSNVPYAPPPRLCGVVTADASSDSDDSDSDMDISSPTESPAPSPAPVTPLSSDDEGTQNIEADDASDDEVILISSSPLRPNDDDTHSLSYYTDILEAACPVSAPASPSPDDDQPGRSEPADQSQPSSSAPPQADDPEVAIMTTAAGHQPADQGDGGARMQVARRGRVPGRNARAITSRLARQYDPHRRPSQ